MDLAVELAVNRRIAQPEIRAEVDDPLARLVERHGELGREPVRQGEEEKLRLHRQQCWQNRLGKNHPSELPAAREPRQHLAHRLAGVLTRSHRRHPNTGMPCKDRAELLAGIAVGSDDRDRDAVVAHSAAMAFARSKRASVRSLPNTSKIS